MDGRNFDALTRAAAAATSRRSTFGIIAGAALLAGLAKLGLADARKKGKGKNKKKKCKKLNQGCGGKKKCCKGLSCTNGTCVKPVPEPECENNADCNAGEICQNGNCVPEPPECEVDGDCDSDEICRNGECVPECDNDNDCVGNEICDGGICSCPSVLGGECVTLCENSSDCPGSCTCRGVFPSTGDRVVCVEDPASLCDGAIGCDQVDECPAGFICVVTLCDSPAGSGRCFPVTCEDEPS